MESTRLIDQLIHNASRIRALVEGVSDEQARWKPDSQSWSILEVINHLYDEERLDFRVRLDIILYRPNEDFPPIDPGGWVTERSYNTRETAASLQNFLDERQRSLTWLTGLADPDWEISYTNQYGSITAGDMFAAWVTHDTLHMRQLVELHHDWIVKLSQPYNGEYAGEW